MAEGDLARDRAATVNRVVATGSRLLVVGAGGSGKSELVDAFLAACDERELVPVVVAGRVSRAGGAGAALEGLWSAVGGAPVPTGAVGATGSTGAVGAPGAGTELVVPEQVADLAERIVSAKVALAVDDAHLLDPISAALVGALWPLVVAKRVPMVVTRRPGPCPAPIGELADSASGPGERLWLGPLRGPDVVARALARHGVALDDATSAALAAWCGGNARLIDLVVEGQPGDRAEVLAGLRTAVPAARGGVDVGAGAGATAAGGSAAAGAPRGGPAVPVPVPVPVADAVAGSVARLGDRIGAAAFLLAHLQPDVAPSDAAGDAATVAPTASPGLAEAVLSFIDTAAPGQRCGDALVGAGLAVEAADGTARLVPLVAAVLRERLSPPALVAQLDVLLAPGGLADQLPAAQRAELHLLRAAAGGPRPGAGDVFVAAAQSLVAGRPRAALGWYHRALELSGATPTLLVAAARAALGAGLHAEAFRLADRAAGMAAAPPADQPPGTPAGHGGAVAYAAARVEAEPGASAGTEFAVPAGSPVGHGTRLAGTGAGLASGAGERTEDHGNAVAEARLLVASLNGARGWWSLANTWFDELGTVPGIQGEVCRALGELGAVVVGGAAGAGQDPLAPAAAGRSALSAACSLLAQGARASFGWRGASPGAVTSVALRAVTGAADLVERAQPVELPETPHAIGAQLAVLCGEHALAESLLRRAIAAGVGGPHLAAHHRALLAWVLLRAGHFGQSATLIDQLLALELAPRDQLVALSVGAGLARRAGSLARQQQAWDAAAQVLLRTPVDLLALAPLGELIVAGAKVGSERVERWLAEAARLLGEASLPTAWGASLAWTAFQAGLVSGRPVAAQAAQVAAATEGLGHTAGLGEVAKVWAEVAAHQVDPEQADRAVAQLRAIGYTWEASQLASHAAVHATDPALTRGLLETARRLRSELDWGHAGPAQGPAGQAAAGATAGPEAGPAPSPGPGGRAGTAAAATSAPAATGPAASATVTGGPAGAANEATLITDRAPFELTPREREVAALFLEGHTYKEMSALLFTSVKTLERHVTNMRTKIGATDRASFLAALRHYLAPNR